MSFLSPHWNSLWSVLYHMGWCYHSNIPKPWPLSSLPLLRHLQWVLYSISGHVLSQIYFPHFFILNPFSPCERKPYGSLLPLCSCYASHLENPLSSISSHSLSPFKPSKRHILFAQFSLPPNSFYPNYPLMLTFFIDFLDLYVHLSSCSRNNVLYHLFIGSS